MRQSLWPPTEWANSSFSRRSLLQYTMLAASSAVIASCSTSPQSPSSKSTPATTTTRVTENTPATGGALQPLNAIQNILKAMTSFPLVVLTERHTLQEMHDFLTALLFQPDLPGKITDIVVEFGNAHYQDLMDRFILAGKPVAKADLQQVWRQLGEPLWDAPIYEQFFRNVRAVNRMLPTTSRLRVLLGQAPPTVDQVLANPHLVNEFIDASAAEAYYAGVVEREVLQKGRRALLIAGKGHLLRGLHADGATRQPNAATLLAQHHPNTLFVIDNLILPPGSSLDPTASRAQTELGQHQLPVFAHLRGTWLGATTQRMANGWINEMADRAISAASARYDAQADAILYFGPTDTLTGSRADPSIYYWGTYPEQLRRLRPIESQAVGEDVDRIAEGLRLAQMGPGWFGS